MTSVVLYFQVHQPFRLRRYTFFDIGCSGRWFDDVENERILRRVAERCYVPMNALLLRAVERTGGRFRCAFSISGTALDQMEAWAPEALEGFQALARTGCVEFLAETSHHALPFLTDAEELAEQITAQAARVERTFGRRPTTFRNTELVIDESVAKVAESLGYTAMLGEGADHLLGWRSPGRTYRAEGCSNLQLLLRSYRLADDVAFRFSNRAWAGWPLTPATFAASLSAVPDDDEFVGLFMDYETFGEHQWKETGILDFMDGLPEAVLAHPRLDFATPSQVVARTTPSATLSIPHPVSWADAERDLTAWLGNPMQREANLALYGLLPAVKRTGRADLLEGWRRLSTSDHLYYMCTKWFSDGDVHKHFSPYSTPHDAFIAFMNVLDDLERRASASGAAAALATVPTPTGRRVARAAGTGAGTPAPADPFVLGPIPAARDRASLPEADARPRTASPTSGRAAAPSPPAPPTLPTPFPSASPRPAAASEPSARPPAADRKVPRGG